MYRCELVRIHLFLTTFNKGESENSINEQKLAY